MLNIRELKHYLYLMEEKGDFGQATGYVLIGDEKACVIDTMFGYSDIRVCDGA